MARALLYRGTICTAMIQPNRARPDHQHHQVERDTQEAYGNERRQDDAEIERIDELFVPQLERLSTA